MKNGIFIFISSIIYTYLLYNQGIGVNILLLNLVLIPTLFLSNRNYLKNKLSLLFAAGALISSVFSFVNGHAITVWANIFSLSFLSISINLKQQTIISSLVHILFSYMTSIAQIVKRFKVKYFSENHENGTLRKRIVIYLSSILVFTLFVILYQASYITFSIFLSQFSLAFINARVLFFYSIGFILIYAFYRPRILAVLAIYEKFLPLTVTQNQYQNYSFIGNSVTEETEFKTGVLMLSLLNGLLLLVNVLDLQFMFGGELLPANISYSEYVHQGIFSLILSIIIAIGIILWYFRGTQNFAQQKTLKVLAYVWIAQNLLMLLSAAYKNNLYINEFSLTYKRIGVYVFLIATAAGLLFTLIKLLTKRSNFYLVKANSLAWYVILVMAVPIGWDKMITEFNIYQAQSKGKEPDVAYLWSLSYQAYPALINYEISKYGKDYMNYYYPKQKLIYLANKEDKYTWQSYNLARCNGYDEIAKHPQLLDSYPQSLFKIYSTHRNLNF
ncbi:MAG: DUF4173 domain-containing protein [Bacteroidota bacterium]